MYSAVSGPAALLVMSLDIDVFLANPRLSAGTYRNVHIMYLQGEMFLPELRQAFAAQRSLVEEYGDNTGSLTVIAPTTPLPSTDNRRASAEMLQKIGANLRCSAMVLQGTGFWASAIRGAVTAIFATARQPCEVRVFDEPEPASAWVSPILGQPVEELSAAAKTVMAAALEHARTRSAL